MSDIDTLRPLDAQAFTWRQLRSAIHSGFVGSQGKLRHPKLVTLTEIIETDAQGRLVDSDGNALFGKLISPKASDMRAQILERSVNIDVRSERPAGGRWPSRPDAVTNCEEYFRTDENVKRCHGVPY